MSVTVLLLIVIFQIKHFIADYPLQGRYMLGKFKEGWGFVPPLASHSAVHAIFTLLIVGYFRPDKWWLAIIDFIVHFLMDRIKAGPRYLGRYKDITKAPFWWVLGFDQMVHHLTHYYIIFEVLKS